MASKLQLRSKIKAVGNIQQITKAMQMVAATKMRKSQDTALKARPYARQALALLSIISSMAKKQEYKSHLFAQKKQGLPADRHGKTCLVVMTSDKGLAGAFNNSVLKKAAVFIQSKDVEVVAVGKKAKDFFAKRNVPIVAEFVQFSDIASLQDAAPLTNWIVEHYQEYKEVVFCSMHFVSALVQQANVYTLLPLEPEKLAEMLEIEYTQEEMTEYLLEPFAKDILETVAQDLVRIGVLHLVFESNASEHSARMLAMKNATENAQSLQERLNLELNKARQSAITQELAEISTAKEALTNE